MKKKFNLFGSLFLIANILLSCETQEEIPSLAENKQVTNNLSIEMPADSGILKFRYKECDYSCQYKVIDNKIQYLDQSIEDIANLFKGNPSIAAYVHENGIIEYFDSEDELSNMLQKQSINSKQAGERAVITSGQLTIFEHPKCTGKSRRFAITKDSPELRVNSLGSDWDNITTSFDLSSQYNSADAPSIFNPAFLATFYQDIDFGGYSISFSVAWTEPNGYIHYLDRYPLYPGSSENWDDQLSSLTFKPTTRK